VEQNRLLGKPRYRWEHDIKMDLEETGYEGMNLIHLVLDSDQWQAPQIMVLKLWNS
jgi:hypothetical protein